MPRTVIALPGPLGAVLVACVLALGTACRQDPLVACEADADGDDGTPCTRDVCEGGSGVRAPEDWACGALRPCRRVCAPASRRRNADGCSAVEDPARVVDDGVACTRDGTEPVPGCPGPRPPWPDGAVGCPNRPGLRLVGSRPVGRRSTRGP